MKFSYDLTPPEGVHLRNFYERAKIDVFVNCKNNNLTFEFFKAPGFNDDLCGLLALEMARHYVARKERKIPLRFFLKRFFFRLAASAIARFAEKYQMPKGNNYNQQLKTIN